MKRFELLTKYGGPVVNIFIGCIKFKKNRRIFLNDSKILIPNDVTGLNSSYNNFIHE